MPRQKKGATLCSGSRILWIYTKTTVINEGNVDKAEEGCHAL